MPFQPRSESRHFNLTDLIKPTEKQLDFLSAIEKYRYVLYGGAKGGGKSYILRWGAIKLLMRYATQGHLGVRGVLFCEDYPALKDRQITKIKQEFPDWLGKLADSQIEGMSFTLAKQFGGGVLALRNLDDPSKYASSEFAFILVDELTKNDEDVFQQLRSIMRWPGIDRTVFAAATNPGGRGHEWVKRYFIDRDFPPNEPTPEEFHFIQAFAKDNPHLSPLYVQSLEGLSEALRAAYLDGSWDLYEGQFFSEWRKESHVIEPFTIPDSWKRIRAIDHGRAAPTACMWGAVDHDGRIFWYREYYMKGVDADVNARAIANLSKGEKYWFTLMDSACYSRTGSGETISEIYARNGVVAEPWPKNREAGWALFHEYLRPEAETGPKMLFFSSCKNAIKTIPSLIHDKNHPEDLDTTGQDHVADAVRGALEYLHEHSSPRENTDPTAIMLDKIRRDSRLSPSNLNKFYGNKMW